MKKYYLLTALAAAALGLASCADDAFIGEETANSSGTISFSSVKKNTTRSTTGKDAAALLGNNFVIYGAKGKGDTGFADKVVFDQYNVNYTENSEKTTESNSAGWEYVGQTCNPNSSVTVQTIKYWDQAETLYDFIAYSKGNGSATTSKINTANFGKAVDDAPTTSSNNAVYYVTGTGDALSKYYITDVNTVLKANYNSEVDMQFRSLASQVRVALYETVPGYSIKNVKFYTAANDASTTASNATETAVLYNKDNALSGQKGIMYVYYPNVGTENKDKDPVNNANYNEAKVKFVADGTNAGGSNDLTLGKVTYTGSTEDALTATGTYLGHNVSECSYAGNYVSATPSADGQVLTLRCNYTLVGTDGAGEVIEVKGAKAQIPAVYAQWLPNYAYTYIFKISDNTNGFTGTIDDGKAGLYPITLDAVIADANTDGEQQTITTVASNSITTYQYGTKSTASNEYVNGKDIYAMVDGGIALTLNTYSTVAGKENEITDYGTASLYTISGNVYTGKNVTEAEVIDALTLQNGTSTKETVLGRNNLTLTNSKLLSLNEAATELTNEDGNTYTTTAKTVGIFKPEATTTYAFVYRATIPTTEDNTYTSETVSGLTAGSPVNGYCRYAYVKASGSSVGGVTYYKKDASTGNYTADGDMTVSPVTGLYTITATAITDDDAKAEEGKTYYSLADNVYTQVDVTVGTTSVKGYYTLTATAATGYAVTGTDYYEYDSTNKKYTKKTGLKAPQSLGTNTYYTLSTTKEACASTETAVDGTTYYKMYTKNNGKYAVKVIKVQ